VYDRIEPIGPDRRVQPVELTILTPLEREEEKQRRERERRRRQQARQEPQERPETGSGGIDIRV
jgi:hypothetical protein